MATGQLGTHVEFNFTNSLKADATLDNGTDLGTPQNYVSITALRTRLAAYDAFTYTSAALDIMSVNDMVFALRSIDDRTTISNYHPAQTARVA